MQNTFIIDVDIKKTSYFNQPTVTSNDDITFVVNISDDGQAFDLADVTTVSLANTKPDNEVVVTPGSITGANQVTFVLGTNETAISGSVSAVVQLYDANGRVSTLSFSYAVKVDPTGSGYVPSTDEQTLIEVVLNDGPLRIQEAIDAGVYATDQGDYALAQGDIAATESANLSTLKTDVQTATVDANVATTSADASAINANTQGDFALAQGTYAKTEADRLVGTDVSSLDVRLTDNTAQLADIAINVKNFGAVGFGDESAIFQAAIDYASAQKYELLIPSEDYLVDTIYLKGNMRGISVNSKVKCNFIYINDQDNITVEGIHFVFDYVDSNGLKINNSNNIKFINCTFENTWISEFSSRHIYFSVSNAVTFVNCKTIGCNVTFVDCKDIKVIGNRIDGNFTNGGDLIKCTSGTSGLITQNTIINSQGDGIDTYTSGERMIITENHFENLAINGVEAKVILRDAPYVAGSSDQDGFVESTIISNNIFKNIGGAVSDSYGAIKNTYTDLRTTPVFEQKNTPRCFIITNNIIEDINKFPGVSGVYYGILSDAHNSIISDNVIRNIYAGNGGSNSGTGILLRLNSKNCIVKGNIVSGAENRGINASQLNGSVIDGNIVCKDEVTGKTTAYGLYLDTVDNCVITNNQLLDCTTYAIQGIGGFLNSILSGNVCTKSLYIMSISDSRIIANEVSNGIILIGDTTTQNYRLTITGNHVKNSGSSSGVMLRKVRGAIMTGNIFNFVTYGILIQNESNYITARDNITSNATGNDPHVRFDVGTMLQANQDTCKLVDNVYLP